MKLEVGMYVRTPLGIDKIKTIYQKGNPEFVCYFLTKPNSLLRWDYDTQVYYFSIGGECFDKDEIKASHNIIDLIEVGDYVNDFKVIGFRNDDGDYYLGIVVPDDDWADILPLSKLTIYSIVTKEQFESMQYKVK